ncbi:MULTISPECIES: hypothetical protein [Chryseobacterium]|uniref:Beta-carotene 15,15'-monooxygenase n=1 Tax=Chryseobacterium camelliae TaxID=1265445 RepID=A0ABU0TMR8_9FLAO|nr:MULTISPECIES: hypothetical protein [Chryseobacterium]MDT3407807.1 hypothetical protein [Pseudacidovorax intermedius]MDQ1098338.1 hypothetical protein [Chryseobacterium camelliae]MDQ1102263.1 hypothetical protein [Chryseobacterium sp. SORGH_AS_1048]MDR6085701.1 hypothetical protein [Chryseobacterium sp. SORGH_AS_0909]MDR6130067.1 hypothetical protein [Chryseobacterium sp. SORGH_AS_1175]
MQNKYPQKPGIDFILKQAFFYWSRTLMYQLMFSVIYFGILFTVIFYFDARYGIIQQYMDAAAVYTKGGGIEQYSAQMAKMVSDQGFQVFSWSLIGTLVFLYPLNLGFYQIFRKIDLGEKLEIGDLLAGYQGINFFRYVSYYIFWFFIYAYTAQTIILAVVWVYLTLLVAPLMFFMDKRIFEAISLNVKALRMYFLEITVCIIVAVIFKYAGLLLFFFGALFTFPFWNAMIYSLYQTVFSEKKRPEKDQVGSDY